MLHTVGAGAVEPLEWSHELEGSDGVWDPLFQPTGDTWLQREFDSKLREVRACADPAGGDEAGAEEGASEALSKECIALRAGTFGDVGKILRAGPWVVQFGLTDDEIDDVWERIQELLDDVDDCKIPTF